MKHETLSLHVETVTALHLGSEANGGTDALFRRTTDGALVVPGTAIAGAIRSHLTRLAPIMSSLPNTVCLALDDQPYPKNEACQCIVCHLMGDVNPLNQYFPRTGSETADELAALEQQNGRASRLLVDDAFIPMEAFTEVRDGVGIERTTGAAGRQSQSKFDLETVPPGVQFVITFTLEDGDATDRALLAVVIEEWQAGRIRLGGHNNRGLGQLKIHHVESNTLDFRHNSAHLMAFLRGSSVPHDNAYRTWHPGRTYHAGYVPTRGSMQHWVQIEWVLHVEGFFITNDTTAAATQGFNHLSRPYLPGGSLRGVLRGQAERIARTIATLMSEDEATFLRRCPAADPLAMASEDKTKIYLESLESRLKRGQLVAEGGAWEEMTAYFDLADYLFGNTLAGSRLCIGDAPLHEAYRPIWKPLDFVSIDRFTGGAADQRKFDALALWQPSFKCHLLLESPELWELGWLAYVIRDLIDGRMHIGMGSAKGMGHVVLPPDELTFTFGCAYDELFPYDVPLAPEDFADGFFRTLSVQGWDNLSDLLPVWSEAWLNKVAAFQVPAAVAHQANSDAYWEVAHLYAKEIDLANL